MVKVTPDELRAFFEEHDADFLEYDDIPESRWRNPRKDVNIFIILNEMCPTKSHEDMICSSEHDEFYLDISLKELANVADKEKILDCIRCGLRIDSSTNSLAMFS